MKIQQLFENTITPLAIRIEWLESLDEDDSVLDYRNVMVSDLPSTITNDQFLKLLEASFKGRTIETADISNIFFVDYAVGLVLNIDYHSKNFVTWVEVVDFCNTKLLSDDFEG